MNYTVFTDFNKIDKKKWGEFVLSHADGNIFQTPSFYQAAKKTKNFEPIIIVIENENGNIQAVLQSLIYNEYGKFLGKLTSRSIIEGGPLLVNNDISTHKKILAEYEKHISKKKVIYTQFRNSFDTSFFENSFLENGYTYEDHLNIIIDLKKTEDDLWKEVHVKRRNEIRKAIKNNVDFITLPFEHSFESCYKILVEVYEKAGLPLLSHEMFRNLYKFLPPEAEIKVFSSIYNNEIIGCMLCLLYKDTIYDYYAGSYQKYYSKNPNDLIPWEVFLWGKKNGFSYFNFGGAGKPNVPYGVRDYKKKFGGTTVNYGRYIKIHKPSIYQISNVGFYFWKKAKIFSSNVKNRKE